MIQIEKRIVIDRPVEEVFAFLEDQSNAPQWQEGLLEIQRTTEGPIGVGTRHIVVRSFMDQRIEVSNEYIEYEPDRLIRFKGTSGPLPFEFTYRTEPVETGTRLTSGMEMHAEGLPEQAEAEMSASLEREMEADLSKLKTLLENRTTVA